MTSVVFSIIDGNGAALAIDKKNGVPGGQLVVTGPSPGDPDQQWTWVFIPNLQAVALFNPGRNLFAAPNYVGDGAPVILYGPDTALDAGTTWQVITDANSAVRTAASDDLGLFVPDGGREVGLFGWGGGRPGEVWTTQIVAT